LAELKAILLEVSLCQSSVDNIEDSENEDNQGIRRTGQVRIPPQSWQHLHARDDQTEEYSLESAHIINAFVQTNIALDGEKVIMKICGQLVDILLELCPGVHNEYVLYKGQKKIVYV
jgi:hypothetical protein